MLEASGAPALSDPTPVCQFPGAREEGLGCPGGLGHRQQWHPPPTLSPFPHWVAFPAEHQSLKMALLNSITAPWECGLALPSIQCGAVATQGPVSLYPHGQSPEGPASPPCPEVHSVPGGRLEAEGQGCARSICRGTASVCPPVFVCNLHSPVGAFQHAMCLPMHGWVCSWYLGPHMCVPVTFTRGPALTWAHATLVAVAAHDVQADAPMCSPLHSYVSATCPCGHAAFTGVCVHAGFGR